MSNVTPPAPAGMSSETVNVNVVVPELPSECVTSSIDRCTGGRLVRLKVVDGFAPPFAWAVTVYGPPAVPLAVAVPVLACPAASVVGVGLANDAEGPDAGAVNVT